MANLTRQGGAPPGPLSDRPTSERPTPAVYFGALDKAADIPLTSQPDTFNPTTTANIGGSIHSGRIGDGDAPRSAAAVHHHHVQPLPSNLLASSAPPPVPMVEPSAKTRATTTNDLAAFDERRLAQFTTTGDRDSSSADPPIPKILTRSSEGVTVSSLVPCIRASSAEWRLDEELSVQGTVIQSVWSPDGGRRLALLSEERGLEIVTHPSFSSVHPFTSRSPSPPTPPNFLNLLSPAAKLRSAASAADSSSSSSSSSAAARASSATGSAFVGVPMAVANPRNIKPLAWSPRGTRLASLWNYENTALAEGRTDRNFVVWSIDSSSSSTRDQHNSGTADIPTARVVASLALKRFNVDQWPMLRWRLDEEFCCLTLMRGEFLVYEGATFGSTAPLVRVTSERLLDVAVAPISFTDDFDDLIVASFSPVSVNALNSLPQTAASVQSPSDLPNAPDAALTDEAYFRVQKISLGSKRTVPPDTPLTPAANAADNTSTLPLTPPPAASGDCIEVLVTQRVGPADSAFCFWSPSGSAVLVMTNTIIDAAGENYGGVGDVYFAKIDRRKPPIVRQVNSAVAQSVAWSPCRDEFVLIEGKSPSEIALYDKNAVMKFQFPKAYRNELKWGTFGSMVAIGGFGNLAGDLSFWFRDSETQSMQTTAEWREPCTVTFDWAPCGSKLFTASTHPRMKVDNHLKIHTYEGVTLLRCNFPALYEARWKPELDDVFPHPRRPVTCSAALAPQQKAYRPRAAATEEGEFGASRVAQYLRGEIGEDDLPEATRRKMEEKRKADERRKKKKREGIVGSGVKKPDGTSVVSNVDEVDWRAAAPPAGSKPLTTVAEAAGGESETASPNTVPSTRELVEGPKRPQPLKEGSASSAKGSSGAPAANWRAAKGPGAAEGAAAAGEVAEGRSRIKLDEEQHKPPPLSAQLRRNSGGADNDGGGGGEEERMAAAAERNSAVAGGMNLQDDDDTGGARHEHRPSAAGVRPTGAPPGDDSAAAGGFQENFQPEPHHQPTTTTTTANDDLQAQPVGSAPQGGAPPLALGGAGSQQQQTLALLMQLLKGGRSAGGANSQQLLDLVAAVRQNEQLSRGGNPSAPDPSLNGNVGPDSDYRQRVVDVASSSVDGVGGRISSSSSSLDGGQQRSGGNGSSLAQPPPTMATATSDIAFVQHERGAATRPPAVDFGGSSYGGLMLHASSANPQSGPQPAPLQQGGNSVSSGPYSARPLPQQRSNHPREPPEMMAQGSAASAAVQYLQRNSPAVLEAYAAAAAAARHQQRNLNAQQQMPTSPPTPSGAACHIQQQQPPHYQQQQPTLQQFQQHLQQQQRDQLLTSAADLLAQQLRQDGRGSSSLYGNSRSTANANSSGTSVPTAFQGLSEASILRAAAAARVQRQHMAAMNNNEANMGVSPGGRRGAPDNLQQQQQQAFSSRAPPSPESRPMQRGSNQEQPQYQYQQQHHHSQQQMQLQHQQLQHQQLQQLQQIRRMMAADPSLRFRPSPQQQGTAGGARHPPHPPYPSSTGHEDQPTSSSSDARTAEGSVPATGSNEVDVLSLLKRVLPKDVPIHFNSRPSDESHPPTGGGFCGDAGSFMPQGGRSSSDFLGGGASPPGGRQQQAATELAMLRQGGQQQPQQAAAAAAAADLQRMIAATMRDSTLPPTAGGGGSEGESRFDDSRQAGESTEDGRNLLSSSSAMSALRYCQEQQQVQQLRQQRQRQQQQQQSNWSDEAGIASQHGGGGSSNVGHHDQQQFHHHSQEVAPSSSTSSSQQALLNLLGPLMNIQPEGGGASGQESAPP